MSFNLTQFFERHRETIVAAGLEQTEALRPFFASASRQTIDRCLRATMESLEGLCCGAGEARVQAWANEQARVCADLGCLPAEVIAGLDFVANAIAHYAAEEIAERESLVEVLASIDKGAARMRRKYLETHAAIRERRLTQLHDLSLSLRAGVDLQEVLERTLTAAQALAGARYAALAIYGQGDHGFITRGLTDEQIKAIGAPPTQAGLLGALPRATRPIRLADLTQDPRFSGFPPHHPPMHSFLGVPVVVGEHLYGGLYLTEKASGDEFNEEDERLLEILATHAAAAVENARLYEALRRQAVSRPLVGQMLRDLQRLGGVSESGMFRAGRELAERVSAQTLAEFLDAFADMGLGQLRLSEADAESKRWTFLGTGLVESHTGATEPTGNYTRGFLCGAVSRTAYCHVAVVEMACESMGDEACRFVAQVI